MARIEFGAGAGPEVVKQLLHVGFTRVQVEFLVEVTPLATRLADRKYKRAWSNHQRETLQATPLTMRRLLRGGFNRRQAQVLISSGLVTVTG